MEEPKDFPSPLSGSTPSVPPGISPKPVVVSIPGLSEEQAFTIAVEALRGLPRPRRNAVVNFVLRWIDLPPGRQAGLALAVMPELSASEVAVLCGKSVRQTVRYDEYRAVKPTLADYLESKRREFCLPDDLEG